MSTPLSVDFPSDLDDPIPSRGEVLSPSHLTLHQFGSRFLPHTTSPMRCLLPILNDTLLLIGHDDGLSVLNMFPKEWTENGLVEHGPSDAQIHHIWVGEGSVAVLYVYILHGLILFAQSSPINPARIREYW